MRRGPPDMSRTVRNFTFPHVRRRYGAMTTNAEGFRVRPAPTSSRILAHTHPAPAESLERLPDGLEVSNVWEGYTPANLRTADSTTGQIADEVVISGDVLEVVEVSPWAGGRQGTRTWRRFLAGKVRRT